MFCVKTRLGVHWGFFAWWVPDIRIMNPKGPCTQIVYALASKYSTDTLGPKYIRFGYMDP